MRSGESQHRSQGLSSKNRENAFAKLLKHDAFIYNQLRRKTKTSCVLPLKAQSNSVQGFFCKCKEKLAARLA